MVFYFPAWSSGNNFNNSEEKEPLIKVLERVSDKYQIIFSYEIKLLNHVEVDFELREGENLTRAINRLLTQTNLKYELASEKFVIIYKNDKQGKKKAKKFKRKIKQLSKLERQGDFTIKQNNSNPTVRSIDIIESVLVKKEEKTITGTVKDADGLPLIGANVQVKGDNIGTVTDLDGKFTLNLPNEANILVISYTGYKDLEVKIGNKTTLNVILEEGIIFEEIVVVGYGTVRKGDVSTSVGVVNASELSNQLTTGFDQALSGKVAGVQVLQTSGSPGGNISIRIRGTSSIGAGNDPLYVIDGIPLSSDTKGAGGNTSQYETNTNPLNAINTNDIESIQILKDAAAAAIYGSRGSNGVILITTKKGKPGKLKVNYDLKLASQSVTKKIDMLDAYQYAALARDARNNTYLDKVPNGMPDDPNEVRIAKRCIICWFISK